MESRDVKLRIELDVVGQATPSNLVTPQPTNPGGPVIPGAPAPDAGAGQGTKPAAPPVVPGAPTPREPTSPDAADAAIDAKVDAALSRRAGEAPAFGTTALGLATAARTGNLSSQVEATIMGAAATIPGGGAIFKSAMIAEKYGPAVAAAAEEALPSAISPLARSARRGLEIVSRRVATTRAYLDAGGDL